MFCDVEKFLQHLFYFIFSRFLVKPSWHNVFLMLVGWQSVQNQTIVDKFYINCWKRCYAFNLHFLIILWGHFMVKTVNMVTMLYSTICVLNESGQNSMVRILHLYLFQSLNNVVRILLYSSKISAPHNTNSSSQNLPSQQSQKLPN